MSVWPPLQTLDVRFGVTVVGAEASGKSSVWKVLSAARTEQGRASRGPSVQVTVLNPKSITMEVGRGHAC